MAVRVKEGNMEYYTIVLASRQLQSFSRRVFQPELCAPKTDEIMRTRYSFEERLTIAAVEHSISSQ